MGVQDLDRRFVGDVRRRMARCEDRDLASEVTALFDKSRNGTDAAAWHITTEITDQESVDSLMAIVRRGKAVAQIGFVTAKDAGYDRDTFEWLVDRALERLAYMPEPTGKS